MSINTTGLPSYDEQNTKNLISKTIAKDKIVKEKELKKLKELSKIYGKGKK